MKHRSVVALVSMLAVLVFAFTACAPAATPEVIEKTVVVEETVMVESEPETIVVTATPGPQTGGMSDADATAVLKGKKLAGILSGPVNDAGWNTNAYLAMVNLRDKFGMEIAYTESTKVEDAAQVMRDYAEAGYDMILAHGYEYADQIKEVALEYPDVTFIQTNGAEGEVANLYTITFSAGEGGYFIGRLACEITKTGKVTLIAGESFPINDHHLLMMKQACTDLESDAEINDVYVGSWVDPAKTKELAKAAIEQGSDVLILNADSGDTGGIEAAKEAREAGNTDLRVISWVKDKNHLGPDFVLGGWAEDVTKEVEYLMRDVIAAGQPGGH
ncbi:MAG: BMP family protein, partial [Anaerolineaceae bacterium]|nr:BMP family protein [Anaerolineaceae bacterium]